MPHIIINAYNLFFNQPKFAAVSAILELTNSTRTDCSYVHINTYLPVYCGYAHENRYNHYYILELLNKAF